MNSPATLCWSGFRWNICWNIRWNISTYQPTYLSVGNTRPLAYLSCAHFGVSRSERTNDKGLHVGVEDHYIFPA